jgi:putative acyl-CoA dehydrogenase
VPTFAKKNHEALVSTGTSAEGRMKQTAEPRPTSAWAATHEVFNQSRPLVDYNVYDGDTPLREAVRRHGAGWAEPMLSAHGARTGSAEVIEWGFLANAYEPEFRSHDRQGNRVDFVRYHESYHRLMALALEAGMHASPWTDPRPGAHVARAAQGYLQAQVDAGHGCPLTMTFASVPTLRATPKIAEEWLPKVLQRAYDPRNCPYPDKRALTIGMGMTEKQGGSDVRANTTCAFALGQRGAGEAYELVGHKWFTSAPMCDAFLMLAQAEAGLSCFLVPRYRPDRSKNPLEVQRLKKKMGNVSNASSEVELRGALGWLIGEEGRGVATIIEMVAMTRFDCMMGSSAAQRQVVSQAVNHALGRAAFGKKLIDQPLMRNVLADLALEAEGSIALTMRMAEALDSSQGSLSDPHESALLRLGLPIGKYWICKRTPSHAYEAMECLGGNAVTEDFIMARMYRDAPINAIWEGSGNVQALDMLRAISKTPSVLDAWFAELERARGFDASLDEAIQRLRGMLDDQVEVEYRARSIIDQLALTMQAALLACADDERVARAFIAGRLHGGGAQSFGTLPRGLDVAHLLRRADPWES